MKINPHKTISAGAEGIVISYRESNKNQFLGYHNGSLEKPRRKYQELSKPPLSNKQRKLYSEAVHGLNAFSKSQLDKMSKGEKKYIIQRSERCQEILNEWKQTMINESVDSFLKAIFPKSRIVKFFTSCKIVDTTIVDRTAFKDLGINQVDIANKLVEVGILPKDFFTLEHSI
jgi:hypothetical protein